MGLLYCVPVSHLSDTQLENMAMDTDNELALELIRRWGEAASEVAELQQQVDGAEDRESDARDDGEQAQYDSSYDEVMRAANSLERDIVDMIEELHTCIDELDAEGKASAKLYISKVMTRLSENVVSEIRDALEVSKP